MMKRLIATSSTALVVCLGASVSGTDTSAATLETPTRQFTEVATADTVVRQQAPDANYGTSRRWSAAGTIEDRRRALLRFDIDAPPPGSVITGVKLRVMSSTDAQPTGPSVYTTSDAWTEKRATWNNAPQPGKWLGRPGSDAGGSWVEWNVIAGIPWTVRSGGGIVSFQLATAIEKRLQSYSRENLTRRPRLMITTSPIGSATGSSTSPTTSAVAPRGVPGTWSLAFQDEFAGDTLDVSKWRPNWLAGSDEGTTKPVNSAEVTCYDPDQVNVSDGALNLTAEKRSCQAMDETSYEYASGLVQSRHDFTYTYGYAEARMYLVPNADPTKGHVGSCGPNWPAFWVNGFGSSVGEIDVMECLGDDTAWTFHWDGYRQKATSTPAGWHNALPAGENGWHTFGVNWQPGLLEFYYDGIMVGRQTESVPSDPHYLIANLGISGSHITVPQTLKIDYIRVWN